MSRQINQPINQVRLTNVAVVRYNVGGKRFEIACYRNKVMDYRAGLEKDLSEVLQTERIFTNVSKGEFAKSADLEKAFGTRDEDSIAKLILEKGNSVQVSDLERNHLYENTLSQIANWVASNCVHPDSGRPYTVPQILNALEAYQVQPHKALKAQYLDAVKFLKAIIPIERAKMELGLTYPADNHDRVEAKLSIVPHKRMASECRDESDPRVFVCQVDPSFYRQLADLAKEVNGKLEIFQQVVFQEGDVDLEKELERRRGQQLSNKSGPRTTLPGRAQQEESLEEDAETLEMAKRLEIVRIRASADVNEEDDDDGIDDDEEDMPQHTSIRKNRRKNAKKGKKDKRREREDAEDRQTHLEAERAHREQRQVSGKQQADGNGATPDTTSQDGVGKSCNTCGGNFANAAAYRAHFRSDWHRFNQKLKLKGLSAVTEQEFLLCDADTFFGANEK